MELKYDHPNFAAAVAVLADRSGHTDEEIIDAVAVISSMIEAERPNQDAQNWNDWVQEGEWGGATIEATLAEVDEILENVLE